MFILGIESSCDETGASVVQDGEIILSNVTRTQIDLHKKFNGVFPELACRRHLDDMLPIIDRALLEARITPDEIDLIAVANQPGLMGALLMGITTAKALGFAWDKPVIGVNHVKAHLYAAMMPRLKQVRYPALGLVVSGGHTFMAKLTSPVHYELIGQSVDDAVGESFDKVASLLSLPYPGGPQIEKLAKKGDPHRFPFKGGQVRGKPFDFSFSGLKTNVLYTLKGQSCQKNSPTLLDESELPHVAASFQHAALSYLVEKAVKAALAHDCVEIYVGGGVSFNQYFRTLFSQNSPLPVYWPEKELCVDNAAMIAGLGWQMHQQEPERNDLLTLEALPTASRVQIN